MLKQHGYTLEQSPALSGVEESDGWEAVSGPVTMSKSAGNGIPVGPFVRQYGSDVARIVVLFAAPPENNMEWTDEGVAGAQRFLNRLVGLFSPDRQAIAAFATRTEGKTTNGGTVAFHQFVPQSLVFGF